jgi:hypothetical protein
MYKIVYYSLLIISYSLFSGCGVGGQQETSYIEGTVADGYLVNATICLDKNSNLACDEKEPFTVSTTNGYYKLVIDKEDEDKYPLLALVEKDKTVDEDDNKTVEDSYILQTPKQNPTFISPFTTLIKQSIDTNKYNITLEQATQLLQGELGIGNSDLLLGDYVKDKNDSTSKHLQL